MKANTCSQCTEAIRAFTQHSERKNIHRTAVSKIIDWMSESKTHTHTHTHTHARARARVTHVQLEVFKDMPSDRLTNFRHCLTPPTADSPNALLTIKDHADLSVISNPSPLTPSDTHQASQSYLAATWTVSTSQGFQPIRYEVSAGRSNQRGPQGVFGVVGSRVWRDVGLETSSLIVIPSG